MNDPRIELLAPAKDGPTAIAAIQCGADAVYIGAERFSAREAAGNPIGVIESVIDFAHQYYARVYVAMNTLLYDNELHAAEKLIDRLHHAGVDGLIIQDVGLLELALPPIPLIASTQMHNATVERVKFWEQVGFFRAILARELTLEQIRAIRRNTNLELECFVHGAMCVGASGQCYLSYALGGRSGNRGQCAQPCRQRYSLHDRRGRTVAESQYLLSLRDLDLSAHLAALIDAGITSFKIEGRLKDLPYVVNTVSFYRQKLDAVLANKGLRHSTSGSVEFDFDPDPAKTFNRGFADFGLTGPQTRVASIETPKSRGQLLGKVACLHQGCFTLDRDVELHAGDGLCFFDAAGTLTGTVVNSVQGRTISPQTMQDIRLGQTIHRNYDHQFCRRLATVPARRRISLTLELSGTSDCLTLAGADEDDNRTEVQIEGPWETASDGDTARETTVRQLSRVGNTVFACSEVRIAADRTYFVPASRLNAARRELLSALTALRQTHRPRPVGALRRDDNTPFPESHITYTGNVLNAKARDFYERHGVRAIAPAAESGVDLAGRVVMTTRYCLRRELGLCRGPEANDKSEAMFLRDDQGRGYLVSFLCGPCGMEIQAPKKKRPDGPSRRADENR